MQRLVVPTLRSIIIISVMWAVAFWGIEQADAQQPEIEWQKTYAVGKSLEDCTLVQADDGDYIIAGTKNESGKAYVFIYRIDPQGVVED